MNNKAQNRVMGVYWFLIFFIVAGGIVYITHLHYGQPFEVREYEANILINQISDCISFNGEIRPELFNEKGFILNQSNILKKCDLNFKTEDISGWNENGQYYIEIYFYDFNSGELKKDFPVIKKGNFNLKDNKNKNYVVYLNRSFYTLNQEDKLKVEINSYIRKTEKNVM